MNDQGSMTEATRRLVTKLYDRLLAGNLEGFLACLADDVEVHEPGCLPYGGVYRGNDGVSRLFPLVAQCLDVGAFRVDAIVADGDRAIGMLRTVVRSTGQPIEVAEESIVRDGKIARVRVFVFDPTLIKVPAF